MASFMCLHTQNLATITEVQWGGESIVNFGASMLAAVKRQTRRPRGITGVRQRGQSRWFQVILGQHLEHIKVLGQGGKVRVGWLARCHPCSSWVECRHTTTLCTRAGGSDPASYTMPWCYGALFTPWCTTYTMVYYLNHGEPPSQWCMHYFHHSALFTVQFFTMVNHLHHGA